MDSEEGSDENRTVFCGNLSENVTDELLFELFHQAGPVQSVRRPRDTSGRPKSFAFIVYKHECSVPYAVELFRLTKLFNRNLTVNSRNTLRHIPVLDTHLTDFTDFENFQNEKHQSSRGRDFRNSGRQESTRKDHSRKGEEHYRRERYYRDEESSSHQRHSGRDQNKPKNWAEFNALTGNKQYYKQESPNEFQQPVEPDFNALLQMGQQLMFPGLLNISGMPNMGGPSFTVQNMFPSMQGGFNGGERFSPPRERDHREWSHNKRENRKHHPYNDRHYSDRREDHKRHDRGLSSSHSSHDRERRERRRH